MFDAFQFLNAAFTLFSWLVSQMNVDRVSNGRSPSSVQLFVVIDRVFGKDDSISHINIMAKFWPDCNQQTQSATSGGLTTLFTGRAMRISIYRQTNFAHSGATTVRPGFSM